MENNIKLINHLLLQNQLKNKKNTKIHNEELRLIKTYISKSNLFIGDKKKLYVKINKYKLK